MSLVLQNSALGDRDLDRRINKASQIASQILFVFFHLDLEPNLVEDKTVSFT